MPTCSQEEPWRPGGGGHCRCLGAASATPGPGPGRWQLLTPASPSAPTTHRAGDPSGPRAASVRPTGLSGSGQDRLSPARLHSESPVSGRICQNHKRAHGVGRDGGAHRGVELRHPQAAQHVPLVTDSPECDAVAPAADAGALGNDRHVSEGDGGHLQPGPAGHQLAFSVRWEEHDTGTPTPAPLGPPALGAREAAEGSPRPPPPRGGLGRTLGRASPRLSPQAPGCMLLPGWMGIRGQERWPCPPPPALPSAGPPAPPALLTAELQATFLLFVLESKLSGN